MSTAPTLVIGIGNPSRGDDALGPAFIELVAELGMEGVELLTDYQLQVEYVLDLQGRERVIFIDAAASGPAPFDYRPLQPATDTSISTHAVSPAGLLSAYILHFETPPPPAFVLAIRGYEFELGEMLSERARWNLLMAVAHFVGEMERPM